MNIRPKASLNGRTGTGLLKGEPGDNGATFTPILDEEGNLSWSNDKGLPNPEPVNIRGPKGDSPASPSSGFVAQDTAPEDTSLMWVDTSDDTEESPGGIVDAIPTPTTASVGQTIVVKSVDENGKPTEWEAADMPSGGEGGETVESGGWELIYDSVLEQDGDSAATMFITKNAEGKEFAYRQIWGSISGTVMDRVKTMTYPKMRPYCRVNGVRKAFMYETYKSGTISGGSTLNAWQRYTVIGNAMIQEGDGKSNYFYGTGLSEKISEIELVSGFTDTEDNSANAYCPLKAGGRITIYGRN